ncbi:MAG: hypothetical protein ABI398_02760 [Devosia sp.]
MNKLALIAAAAIALATFGTAAVYAEGTDDFAMADGNKDKMVSMAEAQGVYPTLTQTLFDQADANKDGNLDAAEFTALQGLTAGITGNGNGSSQASSSSAAQ